MTINTKTTGKKEFVPLQQGISPFHEATAKDLWIPGTMLRTTHGKRFCFSSQLGFGIFPVKLYIMEVFPPNVLKQRMKKCWINEPEIGSQTKVGFIATITIPCIANTIFPGITLKSQLGGIYSKESAVPNEMFCVRKDAKDTVIATLNKALKEKNWYPAF